LRKGVVSEGLNNNSPEYANFIATGSFGFASSLPYIFRAPVFVVNTILPAQFSGNWESYWNKFRGGSLESLNVSLWTPPSHNDGRLCGVGSIPNIKHVPVVITTRGGFWAFGLEADVIPVSLLGKVCGV
jgi:hypothetical protein